MGDWSSQAMLISRELSQPWRDQFQTAVFCVCHAQLLFLPAERPVLKLLLLVFWFVTPYGRLCAPIIIKYGREEAAANILLTAKVENCRGHLGNSSREKHEINCIIT